LPRGARKCHNGFVNVTRRIARDYKRDRNIVFRDFRIRNGGHMAVLGAGVIGWTVDGIVIDTNRDAIDVDTSQNVTLRNSVFNSLNDDAIVMKGSFGGKYLSTKNILIEKNTVSG
jgi:polygalacturonase